MRVVLPLLMIFLLVGCDQFQKLRGIGTGPTQPTGPTSVGPGPGPGPAPAATTNEFEGHHLTIAVANQKTSTSHKQGSEQTWKIGDPITGAPTINFSFDEGHMGKLKQTQVVVNPKKADNSWDHTVIFKPVNDREYKAATDNDLGKWQKFAGGKMEALDALPPGEYVLHFTVNGDKTWDRQSIYIVVK